MNTVRVVSICFLWNCEKVEYEWRSIIYSIDLLLIYVISLLCTSFQILESGKHRHLSTKLPPNLSPITLLPPLPPSFPPSPLSPNHLHKVPRMINANPRSFSFGSVCHRMPNPTHNKIVPTNSMSKAASVVLGGGGPRPGRRRCPFLRTPLLSISKLAGSTKGEKPCGPCAGVWVVVLVEEEEAEYIVMVGSVSVG